jgi:hypothetical protein
MRPPAIPPAPPRPPRRRRVILRAHRFGFAPALGAPPPRGAAARPTGAWAAPSVAGGAARESWVDDRRRAGSPQEGGCGPLSPTDLAAAPRSPPSVATRRITPRPHGVHLRSPLDGSRRGPTGVHPRSLLDGSRGSRTQSIAPRNRQKEEGRPKAPSLPNPPRDYAAGVGSDGAVAGAAASSAAAFIDSRSRPLSSASSTLTRTTWPSFT